MLSNSAMQLIALVEISITMAILVSWSFSAWIFRNQGDLRDSRSPALRLISCGLLANAFFWPLYGLPLELPLAAYARGFTGELSLASMLLLWTAYFSKVPVRTSIGMRVWIAVVAIAFYPLALGFSMVDPYTWGYGSLPLLLGVALTALVFCLAGSNRVALILAVAILAWSIGWHESANLWDYVLDPFLSIWAIGSLARSAINARASRAQSGYLFRKG